MIRVGLLGCGNIGHLLASHAEGFVIAALYDQMPERTRELAERWGGTAYDSFEAFAAADVDLVVEAASVGAVRTHGEAVLRAGKDFVVMSVGSARRHRLSFASSRGGGRGRPAGLYSERRGHGAGQPQDRPDRRDRPARPSDHQEPGVARAPDRPSGRSSFADGRTSASRPFRRTSTSRPRSRSRPGGRSRSSSGRTRPWTGTSTRSAPKGPSAMRISGSGTCRARTTRRHRTSRPSRSWCCSATSASRSWWARDRSSARTPARVRRGGRAVRRRDLGRRARRPRLHRGPPVSGRRGSPPALPRLPRSSPITGSR